MKVVIIDYGSGNIHSIKKAFEKCASEIGECVISVSGNAIDLESATHIVLPGVGAFGDCMSGLMSIDGMIEALETQIIINKKPFLGICVGMQLLAKTGLEHSRHEGLGWIDGEVVPIKTTNKNLKIPHMGWNDLEINKENQLLEGINGGDDVYFVHSYYMKCHDENNVIATVNYGENITAAIAKENIMGTQFHPEKSQKIGLKLIGNFLKFQRKEL